MKTKQTIKTKISPPGVHFARTLKEWKDQENVFTKNGCSVCDSIDNVHNYKKSGLFLCGKHYNQKIKYGKILKRTLKDKNKIVDCGDYIKINLYNKYNKVIAITKTDFKYKEEVKKYKWHTDKNGYAVNTKIGIRLHHIPLKIKKGFDIDHINHDRLDNRECNLRYLTRSQNSLNRKKQSGVYWCKYRSKWISNIMVDYKRTVIGVFKSKKEATESRIDYEKKHLINNIKK